MRKVCGELKQGEGVLIRRPGEQVIRFSLIRAVARLCNAAFLDHKKEGTCCTAPLGVVGSGKQDPAKSSADAGTGLIVSMMPTYGRKLVRKRLA